MRGLSEKGALGTVADITTITDSISKWGKHDSDSVYRRLKKVDAKVDHLVKTVDEIKKDLDKEEGRKDKED